MMRNTYWMTTLKVLPVHLAEQHPPTTGYFDQILLDKGANATYFLSVGAYRDLSNNGKKEILADKVTEILRPYRNLVISGADHEQYEETTFDELADMHGTARHLVSITNPDKLARHGHVGYECSCRNFWHHGKCKHSLEMQAPLLKGGRTQAPL
jgi:hypothetical protein|mmetsp:Transcript_32778/g.101542  ORF Transcript_32778/g.101542 Transcript_32778/m.101542 type:complete len:154 (-) Transcript_32778:448-909(-)